MPIQYVPQGTAKRFRIPRTLAADFKKFLDYDLPNQVMTFEVVQDWYARQQEDYEGTFIRGEIYPDSTKSRYENTDNNMNFRAAVDSGIRKGDMLIQPDGAIFILDWFVALESNNAPSRALRCNMNLEVYRIEGATTDEEGYLIDDLGYVVSGTRHTFGADNKRNIIVSAIPANAYRYDGRPEYSAVSGTPGVTPNALTLLTVQYNEQTKAIVESDRFDWFGDTYEIVDVDPVGLDINGEFGTLKIQAKKMAGGISG